MARSSRQERRNGGGDPDAHDPIGCRRDDRAGDTVGAACDRPGGRGRRRRLHRPRPNVLPARNSGDRRGICRDPQERARHPRTRAVLGLRASAGRSLPAARKGDPIRSHQGWDVHGRSRQGRLRASYAVHRATAGRRLLLDRDVQRPVHRRRVQRAALGNVPGRLDRARGQTAQAKRRVAVEGLRPAAPTPQGDEECRPGARTARDRAARARSHGRRDEGPAAAARGRASTRGASREPPAAHPVGRGGRGDRAAPSRRRVGGRPPRASTTFLRSARRRLR